MLKINVLMYLLWVSIVAISCNEKFSHSKGNIQMTYYPNGNIKTIELFDSLNQVTQCINIDKFGAIDSIIKKNDSLLKGQSLWFYKNGYIENTAIFENGKHSGAAFMFFEDGSIQNHRYWTNGKREGYSTDYIRDSCGTLKNIYYYKSDSIRWWNPASEHTLGISISKVKDSL